MNIIAVDDERYALEHLKAEIMKTLPDCLLNAFNLPSEAIDFAKVNHVDIAFLDIDMYEMNGLLLAKNLKEVDSKINIIFVTAFSQYAIDAVSLRCSGYLLKPINKGAIELEILNLRNPESLKNISNIRIQTFGGFEMFVDDQQVTFSRAKSKEVLAYLINKKGLSASTRELAAILWEDKVYDRNKESYLQTIVADLMKTLKNVKAEKIIVKKRNSLAIDTSRLDCDYYNFQKGDIKAINSYAGDYMSNYPWAEFTVGYIEQILRENR